MKNFHPVRHFHWAVGVVSTLSLAVMFYSIPLLKPKDASALVFNLSSLLQLFVPSTCPGEGSSNDPSLSNIATGSPGRSLTLNMNRDAGKAMRLVVCGLDTSGSPTRYSNTFPNGGRMLYMAFRKNSRVARMELRVIADGAMVTQIADVNDAARVGSTSNGWYFGETFITSTIPVLFKDKLEVSVVPLPPSSAGGSNSLYDSSYNIVQVAAYVSAEPMMRIEKLMREGNLATLPAQIMKYDTSLSTPAYAPDVVGVRLMKASGSSFVPADPLSVKFDSPQDVTISGTVSVSCTSGCL